MTYNVEENRSIKPMLEKDKENINLPFQKILENCW